MTPSTSALSPSWHHLQIPRSTRRSNYSSHLHMNCLTMREQLHCLTCQALEITNLHNLWTICWLYWESTNRVFSSNICFYNNCPITFEPHWPHQRLQITDSSHKKPIKSMLLGIPSSSTYKKSTLLMVQHSGVARGAGGGICPRAPPGGGRQNHAKEFFKIYILINFEKSERIQ